MADINNVNYSEIKTRTRIIWQKGWDVNDGICDVSKEMTQINTVWSGKKCNKFIKVWNDNIQAMAKYFKLLQFDLPIFLGKVAKRFSQIDGEELGTPGYGWGSGLKEIQLTDENTLRFLTEEVKQFQQRLTTRFNTSTEAIDTILAEVRALPWDSDSSQAFLPVLESISVDAKNAISNISATLSDMIIESVNTAEKLEGQNVQEGSTFGSSNQ